MVLASGRPYVGVTQINRNRIYGAWNLQSKVL
jgi:hypothetical protein